MTTKTNIKHLPEGEYFTQIMYSDRHAWAVVKRTAKTVTVAFVETKPDPEWKEKQIFHVGGFCGHMANQSEQTWIFDRIKGDITLTLRRTKRGWSHKGETFVEGKAWEYYDYNF